MHSGPFIPINNVQPGELSLRETFESFISCTDASTLRSKYRVTGILIGTLPSISQQNVFLGLPLLLMPEEVVLLVENGSCFFGVSIHSGCY